MIIFQWNLIVICVILGKFEGGAKRGNEGEFIGKFTTPAELREYMLISQPDVKPLLLHHIIIKHSYSGVLVFCNTWEGTHRLAVLLHALGGLTVREFSAKLDVKEKNQVLDEFKNGAIDV